MKGRTAITLVEVLVAIAVVLVIAAIVFPAVARSKRSALKTNDLSNLHQLALAAAIYSDTSSSPPRGCPVLVDANLAPEALCAGKLDPYEEGLANRLVAKLAEQSTMYGDLDVPYRHSFVGWRELAIDQAQLDDAIGQQKSVGWLVDLATTDNIPEVEPNEPGQLEGRYRRLMLDGSVQWRPHAMVKSGPRGRTVWMPIMWFADVDDQWVRAQSLPMP